MRIAFVVHKFPPESVGGTEIYTWGLGRTLAALGHEVHIFHPLVQTGGQPKCLERDGLQLWRVMLPVAERPETAVSQFWHSFRRRAVEQDFCRFLDAVRPDLVHFQHVQGVSAALIRRAAGCPRVVTLHDYWYHCANGQLILGDRTLCPGPRGGWPCGLCGLAKLGAPGLRAAGPLLGVPFVYRNWALRRMLRGVDLFVSPSEFVRERYLAEGLGAERIITVEHGLDSERLAPDSAAPSGPDVGRPHFGFLGSIAWQKGVHVLIDAFNRLPASAALTIYGDLDTFPQYVSELRELARHPKVRFAGALPYRHIGDALRQLDYLVVPSLWYETFCLVAQEALGVGVPVVASRLGALPERVRDGESGRLFSPGDVDDLARVLEEVTAQPELSARYRTNILKPPTMREHAESLLALYRCLPRSPARRG